MVGWWDGGCMLSAFGFDVEDVRRSGIGSSKLKVT